MRKSAQRVGWIALIALLLTLLVLLAWEPLAARPGVAPPPRAYRAQITRDEFGVPHIYGRTDADAAYGIAWAHAEDDFFTLQDVLAMTRGRYGAIAGQDGAKADFILALLDARGTVDRTYDALPADVRALLDGYASGLNAYAAAHPGEIKLARLFPVSSRDIATGFALRQPFFFGLDKVIGPLAEGTPLAPEEGPAIDPTPRPLPGPDVTDDLGSNAFAIAPAKSGDNVTRLVSNAHQPYRGGVAWYELVVESGEGWHFAGATFAGSPYPFLGHNEHLGWTNTVNHPDMVDVYKLVLDASGTRYRLDGRWLPLEERRVRLPVRIGPLTIPVWRKVWASRHGPVLKNAHGAFAFRYGGIGRIDQLTAYYRLNKARDFAQWKAALATSAVPSTNFIYADETGRIADWYNAAIPDRAKGYDWRHILPGDDSRAIWHRPVPWESLPHYVNPASGYLFNANNTPFVAAGPSNLSPASVPAQMGVELRMTNRARRAAKLLAQTPVIGRQELERIKYDTGWENAGYVRTTLDGIAALDLAREPELRRAQRLIAGWDFTSDGVGRADSLTLLILQKAMADSYNNRPLRKPRALLEDAVTHLTRYFGRIDPPMSDVLRIRQGGVDLPDDGGGDTLRAAANWDIDADGRLSVKHGDAFIMFMEWAPGQPVRSQSIQPYGAAIGRPGAAHFADQAPLFVRHQLKPVHFFRADVQAHAARRYIVQNR